MRKLSQTSFGAVYSVTTDADPEESGVLMPPNWHHIQCLFLGFGQDDFDQDYTIASNNHEDNDDDDDDTDGVMSTDHQTYNYASTNKVEKGKGFKKTKSWVVKTMDPEYRLGKKDFGHGLHDDKVFSLGFNHCSDGYVKDGGTTDKLDVLKGMEKERIAREVALHANAKFSHPHIVKAVWAELSPNGCGLIVFKDEGLVDLFEYLQVLHYKRKNSRCKRELSPSRTCRQVCEALAFLHGTFHLVHNDVKPENVLIDPQTHTCLLSDFGGATEPCGTGEYDLVTASRFFVAPERLRGDSFDERADSWSLGMLCCELLSRDGGNPFEQTYTRDRWHRTMMQNFSEPLTDNIWKRRLQPFNVLESQWARWFLSNTLRVRPKNRCSASELIDPQHDDKWKTN